MDIINNTVEIVNRALSEDQSSQGVPDTFISNMVQAMDLTREDKFLLWLGFRLEEPTPVFPLGGHRLRLVSQRTTLALRMRPQAFSVETMYYMDNRKRMQQFVGEIRARLETLGLRTRVHRDLGPRWTQFYRE